MAEQTKKENNKKNKANVEMYAAKALQGLDTLERVYRKKSYKESLPFARNTSYRKIVTEIIPDRDATKENQMPHKVFVVITHHFATAGLQSLMLKINDFLELNQMKHPMDILSISGGVNEKRLTIVTLLRLYNPEKPEFMKQVFDFLGEAAVDLNAEKLAPVGLNTEDIKYYEYTPEELEAHRQVVDFQINALEMSTEEAPFLNSIDTYVPMILPEYDDRKPLMYKLRAKERRKPTLMTYSQFVSTFQEAMRHITTVEVDSYYNVLRGREKKDKFMDIIVKEYLIRVFVEKRKSMSMEDLGALMEKLEVALFDLYVVQDLINDPDISDIKITDPDTIRVRIHGRAYLSDVTFIDENDYMRFIQALIIRNNIDSSVPTQTFTDENDENYILRFSITMPYISSTGFPVLHIRKIARRKMSGEDLMNAGMFDEKIMSYLLDCGQLSSGVVFAGPPGSGKTIMLNWFLETAYEDSAEILVIQENDELFAYRRGVIFQHVVNNPVGDQKPCSLEDLGQMALVAGANVFIIGESKGAEICSAITLANSGCRTAMTIHSRSSVETLDKMADLAMRGYAKSFEQAKRMLTSFQTIVYLENFKVQEISEVIRYDEDLKDIVYRPIYRRDRD